MTSIEQRYIALYHCGELERRAQALAARLASCDICPRECRCNRLENELGCHNINFVSPSHFVPQLVQAVLEAVPMGLRVPLVYNTSGYDSVASLKELDGIISIYLPDLRYASDRWAKKFSLAPKYVALARQAIREMYRQVGDLVVDEFGLAQRGLIVRHLILPNGLAGSEESLTWLVQELSPTVTVSIMSQYMPMHLAPRIPLLSRTISVEEYETVLQLLTDLGLENGWVQEVGAAENYLPDFEREGHPFPSAPERREELTPTKVFRDH